MTGYNWTPEEAAPLLKKGAVSAASPRELASACNVVISSLENDAVLRIVLTVPEGALQACRPGAF